MNYSPLRYPGGKSALAPFLESVILCNNFEDYTYIEPFAGGAGAALALLFNRVVGRIHINDADKAIYSFWHSVLYETGDLIEKIKNTDITVEEWFKQKNIYGNEVSLLEKGFAALFLNRCNRSGIIATAGPIGGLEQNGRWKIDARFNKVSIISRIKRIADEKKNILLSSYDARELITKTDRDNYFFYLDPPYYTEGGKLYFNVMKDCDHNDIAELIQKFPGPWIMTYDNAAYIKSLYAPKDNIKIYGFDLRYSLQNKAIYKELLIAPDTLFLPQRLKINGKYQNYRQEGVLYG